MFSLFSKKTPNGLTINGAKQAIKVNSKETILQAALRENVSFPHSCRVGGCAVCKCKLIKGKVKELTESAYLLSKEELAEGYILACQSVPKGDVEIQVVIDANAPSYDVHAISGTVTKQWPLTHDITAIEITLDEDMEYSSGQFANIAFPELSNAVRSYSFATAYSTENKRAVQFFIKHVPNGIVSTIVNSNNLVDKRVIVEGPSGDFYLRESQSDIVCVAGGSGLAPIKALLEQALADNVKRDVTFLFAARQQQDLYCLNEIIEIENKWPAKFRFIPVLSDEPESSNWTGERGYVNGILSQLLTGSEQAYLCGPPVMIDSVVATLNKHSITSDRIFFDKFITSADIVAA